MLYVPSRNAFAVSKLSQPDKALDSNLLYMQTPGRNPQMPDGLPLFKPPYSRMTAIDMNTGNHAWMIADRRRRSHPQQPAAEGARTCRPLAATSRSAGRC